MKHKYDIVLCFMFHVFVLCVVLVPLPAYLIGKGGEEKFIAMEVMDMRTRRWIGPLLGLLMLIAFGAQPNQTNHVVAAGPCVTPAYLQATDAKGNDFLYYNVPDATEQCVNVETGPDRVAVIGGGTNRIVSGSTELHNVPQSVKALKWDAIMQAYLTYGQVRLYNAVNAQCGFELWVSEEKGFVNGGFPLDEWANQTPVCGGGGSNPTFTVEAKPGLVQPGQSVQFTVTSDPTGKTARLQFDAGNMVDVQTPKAINWTYTASSHWKLLDMQGGELAAGDVEVLPSRDCFALPGQDKWNEGPVPFSFSTEEDTTKQNVLRICGDMPSGYVLLISGEFVAGESYGVLSTYAGHIDFYVRNAFVEGVAGCSAKPEFDRLKKEGAANLTIFHAPVACNSHQFVPIAKR